MGQLVLKHLMLKTELANLLACVSQLCQKLNLQTPKELYRPMFFKHWRHFSDLNWYTRQAVRLGYGGCSFVPIYIKNYRVAEHPFSFKNWGLAVCLACNYPCSLTSPRKLTKLPPWTDWWWTTKPLRWKAQINSLPSWQGGEATVYRVQ